MPFRRLLSVPAVLLLVPPIWAQNPVPTTPPATPPKTITFRESLDQETSLPEPFLMSAPYFEVPHLIPIEKPRRLSLAEMAGTEQRIVKVGQLTILAPRETTIINIAPGKPQLFSSLSGSDRFKLLLGSLSEAQWQSIGSAAGLGVGDLTDDQKPLFETFLPTTITVQVSDVAAGDDPDSREYKNSTQTQRSGADVRMHLSRRLSYSFAGPTGDRSGGSGDLDLQERVGTKSIRIQEVGRELPGDKGKAFGQPILKTVPAQPKPSQINYAARALDGMVPLNDLKRIGDLIERIAQSTSLPITCDKRLADLPLYSRGKEARAGDLLLALADIVSGTYRLVGNTGSDHVYILTDDLEGIGSRFLRLSKWASEAWQARYSKLEGTNKLIAAKNPLRFVAYDADDPLAAPPQVSAAIAKAWSKNMFATPPSFVFSSLPAPIRDQLYTNIEWWHRHGQNPRTDKVMLTENLKMSWVIPGVGMADDIYTVQGLGGQFLQSVSPVVAKTTVPDVPKPLLAPHPFPAALGRRVLIIAPSTAAEAVQLVRESGRRGFTDVWVQVACEPGSVPLLTKVVWAGKAAKIRVGGVVRLLQGTTGEPERNIAGETETVNRDILHSRQWGAEHEKWMIGKKTNWVVADKRLLTETFSALAAVPGLSALVLRSSAAPGYIGEQHGGDMLSPGEEVGYTTANRLAYIRKSGIDPVDIARYDYNLGMNPALPLFPADNATLSAWFDFRLAQNRALLRDLFTTVRAAAPQLPLFLTDRASDFCEPDISWYGSWDAIDRLPQNPLFREDPVVRNAAHTASKTTFLNSTVWWNSAENLDGQTEFGRFANRVANNALAHWNGLVIDMSLHGAAETLRLIRGIPTPTESAPKGNR